MIKPVALVNGHYECRSLEQSVPILEELLVLKTVFTAMKACDHEASEYGLVAGAS